MVCVYGFGPLRTGLTFVRARSFHPRKRPLPSPGFTTGAGSVSVILQFFAPARGMSTAIHGLSMKSAPVDRSIIVVPRYRIGSPFSLLLLSMKRAMNTPLGAFGPRLNARPPKYMSPFVPGRTTASAPA